MEACTLMPTKKAPRITAWSWSRLSKYEGCPGAAKHSFIDKLKDEGGPAMERGRQIDQEAGDYALGKLAKMPASLELFKEEFEALRILGAASLQTQVQLAFTSEWKPTGWFAKDAWCRVVWDMAWRDPKDLSVLRIVDNKSGKVRAENEAQIKLYALAGLLQYPDIETVDARLWYLDQGESHPDPVVLYTRTHILELKKYWEKRVKPMLNDTKFKYTPDWRCNYCPFSQKKKGPCTAA